jgi:hypothetical protein
MRFQRMLIPKNQHAHDERVTKIMRLKRMLHSEQISVPIAFSKNVEYHADFQRFT